MNRLIATKLYETYLGCKPSAHDVYAVADWDLNIFR